MFDIKSLATHMIVSARSHRRRLSATQILMVRGTVLFTALVALGAMLGGWAPTATAADSGDTYTGTAVMKELRRLQTSLDTTSGELLLARLSLKRAQALLKYSARYRVPADLAQLVYDVALREGIDPELGFRLVSVESGFMARARSRAKAYGLTQVQLATARFYDRDVTVEELYEPEHNLELGFRYLRDLIQTYGDIHLALLAYNRGPSKVRKLMEEGRDPDNGYPTSLMEGYRGGS
ncbi:MAG: lytic transglycosylase domain-containing protein [Gemmatimonadales bacterium]